MNYGNLQDDYLNTVKMEGSAEGLNKNIAVSYTHLDVYKRQLFVSV